MSSCRPWLTHGVTHTRGKALFNLENMMTFPTSKWAHQQCHQQWWEEYSFLRVCLCVCATSSFKVTLSPPIKVLLINWCRGNREAADDQHECAQKWNYRHLFLFSWLFHQYTVCRCKYFIYAHNSVPLLFHASLKDIIKPVFSCCSLPLWGWQRPLFFLVFSLHLLPVLLDGGVAMERHSARSVLPLPVPVCSRAEWDQSGQGLLQQHEESLQYREYSQSQRPGGRAVCLSQGICDFWCAGRKTFVF